MKKLYLFVCLSTVAFSLCFLTSCGGISVKGANGETFESYQECCSANDYEAAHLYLTKMKNAIGDDWDKEREYKEARSYVFKKETLFLMSQESEDAQKRIIYLLKEQQGGQTDQEEYNNNIAMLIDLAIENDDEEFVKRLANQYDLDNRYTRKSYLSNAVKYLAQKPGDKDYLAHYLDINDENVLTVLAALKTKELSDAIIKAISSIELSGTPLTRGLHEYSAYSASNSYVESVLKYNKSCDKVLSVAINTGNNYLAQKSLLCFKQNMKSMKGHSSNMISDPDYKGIKAQDGSGVRVDGNHSYVWYTNEDKIAAQKKYDEAVRSGAFN